MPIAAEDHDARIQQAIRHAQQPHPDADQRQVDDQQHQVADPHRGDHAPDEFRLLLHHLRTRHDAVNGHRADHQRHHRVRRDAERQQRNERGLRRGIVGAFRRRDAFDRALAEPLTDPSRSSSRAYRPQTTRSPRRRPAECRGSIRGSCRARSPAPKRSDPCLVGIRPGDLLLHQFAARLRRRHRDCG